VRRDHLVRGLRVLVLLPALGQHELLVLGQHRKLADLGEVPAEAAFRRDRSKSVWSPSSVLSFPRTEGEPPARVCSDQPGRTPFRFKRVYTFFAAR
jgi:hypothetical protein